MLLALFGVIDLLLRVLSYIIIAQAIISWLVAFNVINTTNDFVRSFLYALYEIPSLLLTVLTWIIIVQAIISWLVAFNVINTGSGGVNQFLRALDRITEPLYRPNRRLLPDFGGIDFSPLVVLLLLRVVGILLSGLYTDLAY